MPKIHKNKLTFILLSYGVYSLRFKKVQFQEIQKFKNEIATLLTSQTAD